MPVPLGRIPEPGGLAYLPFILLLYSHVPSQYIKERDDEREGHRGPRQQLMGGAVKRTGMCALRGGQG